MVIPPDNKKIHKPEDCRNSGTTSVYGNIHTLNTLNAGKTIRLRSRKFHLCQLPLNIKLKVDLCQLGMNVKDYVCYNNAEV